MGVDEGVEEGEGVRLTVLHRQQSAEAPLEAEAGMGRTAPAPSSRRQPQPPPRHSVEALRGRPSGVGLGQRRGVAQGWPREAVVRRRRPHQLGFALPPLGVPAETGDSKGGAHLMPTGDGDE